MAHIYQPTGIVLAKVKGYPAWPALIVPNELIPEHVMRNRSRNQSSQTKNISKDETVDDQVNDVASDDEDVSKYIVYSDILKFRKFDDIKSQYCVKFFCDDSYIWVRNNDVQLLTEEDCDKWLNSSKKKNKKLIPAYEMARKGSQGVDVWEFIEYGSAGKPDDEEYVEELEENNSLGDEENEDAEDNQKVEFRSKRTSKRQAQKLKKETQARAEKNVRNTRSRQVQELEQFDEDPFEDGSLQEPESKRARSNAGNRSKGKKNATAKVDHIVEKYHYENDEDWTIVGLGPQELSIQKNASSFVNKLSQKKNYSVHVETKLDLMDRLVGVNKLMENVILTDEKQGDKVSREDVEMILDELDLALDIKGAHDEYITVLQSNVSLLTNFRLLLNLRHNQLKEWDLWTQFQAAYKLIYLFEFVPDSTEWTKRPTETLADMSESFVSETVEI